MNGQSQQNDEAQLEALLAERNRWLAFLRPRVKSEAVAEDILQESLVRAMKGAGTVRREEDLFAWFYRVLRHAVVDTYRKYAAESRRDERFAVEFAAALDADRRSAQTHGALCACIRPRLAQLNPRYARLLEAVDLDGKTAGQAAAEEGISPKSIHVTLHRARQALRLELVRFCGACAGQACLDCSCSPPYPFEKTPEKKISAQM